MFKPYAELFELEPVERRVLLAGSISGTVYSDINSNGVQDTGEPGLQGWTVYIDANNNNIPDTTEAKQITDAEGFYQFNNLFTPAQHVVRHVLQQGWAQTIPGSGGVILDGGPDAGTNSGNNDRKFTQTEIVVAFQGNVGLARLQQRVAADATLRRQVDLARSSDMFSVSGTTLVEVKLNAGADVRGVVARFANAPGVAWAQPNYIYDDFDPREFIPNDPQYGSQYHHPKMQNHLAWDLTHGDPRVVIAITDDGFDTEHQDLYLNIWVNQDEIPASRLANLTDLNGDGYISMEELNDPTNRGPFKANDINSDGRITATDLLAPMIKDVNGDDTGNGGWTDNVDQGGNTYVDDITGRDFWNNDNDTRPASGNSHGTHVMGIAAARTNNGIGVAGTAGRVTVMPIRFYSLSGGSWTSTIVSNSYRYAANNGAKILSTSYNVDSFSTGPDQIFAAGLQYMYDKNVLHFNSGGNSSPLLNPARQRWDQSLFVVNTNANDIKDSSSKYGWGMDVSAPGTGILSTLPNNSYGNNTGTSMSTPNAAGVAALIWSQFPNWTREQVAAQVLATSDFIDTLPGNTSFAGLLGAGRTNSFRALTQTANGPRVKSLTGLPVEGSFITAKPNSFTMDIWNIFDPATMNISGFELRGDGLDGIFNTNDDVLIPINVTFGSALNQTYMIGNNRLNFTIPGTMVADRYRFSALPALKDPFGTSIDGNGDGTAGDAFTRSFILLPTTNAYFVNLDNDENVTNAHFGNHDIAPPRALVSQFNFATAHQLVVEFNEDVSATLALEDLALQNLTTNTPVDTSGFSLAYDLGTNTATISFNTILDDANYQATFAAAGISDVSGNTLDGNANGTGGDDLVVNFFFLNGDANHDGRVNLGDFNILAANFGESPRDFTQGDFNYDGQVNLADFNILAGSFGNTLGQSATEATVAPSLRLSTGGGTMQALSGKASARGGAIFSGKTIGVLKSADQDDRIVLLDDAGRLVLL